jgi:hypothetical protein
MAIVERLEKIDLTKEAKHSTVNCTYSIVNADGKKFLQIDTYGSLTRKMPGKKSQSLRFSPEAIQQLKSIIDSEFDELTR